MFMCWPVFWLATCLQQPYNRSALILSVILSLCPNDCVTFFIYHCTVFSAWAQAQLMTEMYESSKMQHWWLAKCL